MAKVATKRIKVHGQWVLPGQPIPDKTTAAEAEQLIAAGLVREEVSAAEAAAARNLAAKVARLQARAEDLRASITAAQERLAELGPVVDLEPLKEAAKGKDAEAKEALRVAKAENAERERLMAQLEKDRVALEATQETLATLEG